MFLFIIMDYYYIYNKLHSNGWKLSQNIILVSYMGHYLYGDFIKSLICMFRPEAKASKVSAVGDISFLAIRLIVDLDMPVMIDTWRIDRFLFFIISASNISIFL